tara:strand:+ start:235 stop:804 length:570 start_codon:yes stop_codon:yes gene_type:complete
MKKLKILSFFILITFLLQSCNGKLPGGDARKFPADPKKRVEQNLKEGKGFRLSGEDGLFGGKKGGVFEFASSNELWRASLDVLDFMPLSSVNYSGGIIITDWYNNNNNPEESIKITIRFLTNEIRSDALNIKVFTRKCSENFNCKIFETNENIVPELTKKILKTATLYEQKKIEKIKKKNKDYKYPGSD